MRPQAHRRTPDGIFGSGARNAPPASPDASLRLPSRLREGAGSGAPSASRVASSGPASVRKARLRSLAAMDAATFPHVPSTPALCLGLRTPVGMMAVTWWVPRAPWASSGTTPPPLGWEATPVSGLSQTVPAATPPKKSQARAWHTGHALCRMPGVAST